MSEELFETVNLDKWAYGGESMGRLADGRVIFIPDTIPGEIVKTRIIENKKGYARGVLSEIIEPSPLRIDSKCIHFGKCGGCAYQHLSISSQQFAKEEILVNQLSRIGNIKNPILLPMIKSENHWQYQTQSTFILNKNGELSFPDRYSREYIPAKDCPLLSTELSSRVEQLVFPDLPDLAQVQLRIGSNDNDLLILESFSDEPFDFEIDFPISVVQIGSEMTHILSDRFYQIEEFSEQSFRLSASSEIYFQEEIAYKISKLLNKTFTDYLIKDLIHIHAGIGQISLLLAPNFESIVAIEKNGSEADDFIFNLDSFDGIDIFEASTFQVLPTLSNPSSAILISPKDNGIDRFDLDAILKYQPPMLAYLSQNLSTLGRDAKRITEKGYELLNISPIDNSPHSSKIESLSFWVPLKK
jgi:23S rRNA (uracil1939-C5)-methyltransferase